MVRLAQVLRVATPFSLLLLSAAVVTACSHDVTAPVRSDPPAQVLTIIPSSLSLGIGDSYQLETAGATSFDVFWTSSDPEVASVSADGLVIAKAAGAAAVTAEAIGGRASASVYVGEAGSRW